MATCTRRSAASLVLLFLALLSVSSVSAHNHPPPQPCDVKSLCRATPFPDLCSKSTSLLSPLVADDLTKLVRAFLGLSVSSAKSAAVHVRTTATDVQAVRSCAKNMADAVDVLELAVKEVDRLGRPGSQQYARCVGTAQALVNAAIADADACLKLLGEVPNSVVVSETVKLTVTHTMQLSSNALVFVNKLNNAPGPH